jgi:hypothetical protein
MCKHHGDRFVCILYFYAKGIKNRPIDSDKIFAKLPTGGFSDKLQARAELVQYLEDEIQPRIEYNGSNNMVNLTDVGLQWTKSVSDKPPYLDYRYLLNNS